MSSLVARQSQSPQTIEKYQCASLFCSFSQKATITAFVMTTFRCSQDHYSEWRSLNFHPLLADPRLYYLIGMLVGGFALGKVHHRMHTKAMVQQIYFEMKKYALGDVPEKKPTRKQRCIAFSNKINKGISLIWDYICCGWLSSNRAQNAVILECLDDERRFDHVNMAKKYYIQTTPIVRMHPLRPGVCFGISLYFAQQYLNGKTKEKLTKELSRGAPKEAVILQGQANSMWDVIPLQDAFQHKNHLPTICQKIHIARLIMIETAQLNVGQIFRISNLQVPLVPLTIKEGIYEINFSLTKESGHSVILIKEAVLCFLFDSNEGLLTQESVLSALEFLLDNYSIDKLKGFTIIELLKKPVSIFDTLDHIV